ncbi:MAG: hypothetical protein ACI85U_003805, partial [Candidatus Promineifilaceae bacterium]
CVNNRPFGQPFPQEYLSHFEVLFFLIRAKFSPFYYIESTSKQADYTDRL